MQQSFSVANIVKIDYICNSMAVEGNIVIKGARVNNLKNISLEIPRGKLVVITGISGSGKSSLAFDTLFAEGQRRFAESLSSYARQFLGRMSKPDVDIIEGVPPAIAIEQKVNVKNPRSTVGTTTEIYDYLRLIYARIGRTISPVSGREVKSDTVADVLEFIESTWKDKVLYLLADLKWQVRQDKIELLLSLKEQGYSRLWTGKPERIDDVLAVSEKSLPEDATLLVDRVSPRPDGPMDEDLLTRLHSSLNTCFSMGEGVMFVASDDSTSVRFSTEFELDGIKFARPDEYMFSFNSPLGACKECTGLGKIIGVSEDLVVPDKTMSLYDGAIACWRGDKMGWFKDRLVAAAESHGIPIFTPYCQLTKEQRDLIWNSRGTEEDGNSIIGIRQFFDWVESNRYKIQYKYMLSRFSGKTLCPACGGSRLRKDAQWVKVGGKSISELLAMDVASLLAFMETLELTENERAIAGKAVEEIISRLRYIRDVGLDYLTLDRASNTLSGGESQRVNLVTALGSSLVGSMYILDEPSIGLHPRDTERLIGVLKSLRDLGNTVIVVEHDEEIMRAADLLIDMGPYAGSGGGELVYIGKASAGKGKDSITIQYLEGERKIPMRAVRPWTYSVNVEGAMEHNLKDINVRFPLGTLTVVTGVSGSGKSSLIGDILYPALQRRINETGPLPGVFRRLSGNIDRIARVEYVDQNPIGRSSRSNAVTYLKVYDDIRKLFSAQQYARINGYTPSFFSFNQEGGRCPECQGEGIIRIPMQFMADVTMVCDACGGKRFKADILEVRYKGKNIDDVLDMSVDEAMDFFDSQEEPEAKTIAKKLKPLADVGLSYIKLGQSSSTLSGGESQRIKLASFLGMEGAESRKKILFLFDEPTTGLHFFDIEKLLKAFDALLANGHSLIVVEHNPEIIRRADWIVDLGPEAGDDGGNIVFEGTPDDLLAKGKGHTADYMRKIFNYEQ